jgi:predicted lipid-binding transport protein (Tim44 family)
MTENEERRSSPDPQTTRTDPSADASLPQADPDLGSTASGDVGGAPTLIRIALLLLGAMVVLLVVWFVAFRPG